MSEHLIEELRDEQARRCHYGTRDGDGRTCDCKYRMLGRVGGEMTGCAELRAAIRVLTADLPADRAPERGQA